MIEWSRILKESPIDWLLEESNPSVRYFTLRDILDKLEADLEVMAAREAISKSTVVQKILRKQHPQGYWDKLDSPYLPKYKSSYWTIMILGQLGMNRTNGKVEKACEFIFQFQHETGGFSSHSQNSALREYEYLRGKGRKLPPKDAYVSSLIFEEQLSCLTGNMVAALIRMGYVDDLRVKMALEWLVKIRNNDGGWLCPYWKAYVKDKHGCFTGTICPMEALSEVPKEKLTNEMRQAISKGADFLLMHRLFKADHHDYKMISQAWLQLSFPSFAGYNILRGLDVLTKLGYVKDERLDDAVEVLMQKQQGNGVWILENSPEGRMQANVETKGQPSKWITLAALKVLKKLRDRA
jgi:hypothetical protein